MATLPFFNRIDAAQQLAEALAAYRGANPLILAIPRGGVPVGEVLATKLDGELDVILVHKLGSLGNAEFAIGAIDEQGRVFRYGEKHLMSGMGEAHLRREAAVQLSQIQERRRIYGAGRTPIPLKGRTVIVVDDGLATGATMTCALRAARGQHPAKLVCAVPVAAPEGLSQIKCIADDVVYLAAPPWFGAVGAHYVQFGSVSDEEVVHTLQRCHPEWDEGRAQNAGPYN